MPFIINSIAVCGAGTMGSGIALCAAQHGIYTILYDVNEATLVTAQNSITQQLQKLVTKQKLTTTQVQNITNNLLYTNDLHHCIAEVIIEAIIESVPAKVALLNQLAEINHGETIFATNTSSLSVTAIAAQVLNSHRIVGMHFFNPATLMPLVEIVHTCYTKPDTLQKIMQLCNTLNKTSVLCADTPGFIVNRVARHYYLEALALAETENIDYKTIDKLLLQVGFKMGAFALMDTIGNDINHAVTTSLYNATNLAVRFTPSALQASLVAAGKLGKKTGEGFYKYNN